MKNYKYKLYSRGDTVLDSTRPRRGPVRMRGPAGSAQAELRFRRLIPS
jgi:hypothetical protein